MSSRNYEGMFILDNNAATADFEGTSGQVDAILEKHGATVVQKEKWDERKLAYEIKGHRRGTYYLTYFQADPDSIRKINEDVGLNEVILRHLVLALDVSIEDYIATMDDEREKLAEDSRKNALGGWGRRGERRGPPPRARAGEAKPGEAKPEEGKPEEAKPEAKTAEEKPAEAASEGAAPAEAEKAEAEKTEEKKPDDAKAGATTEAATEASTES